MRNRIQITTATLCVALAMTAYADLNGTFKTIALDGSLADWNNPADVLYGGAEIGVGTPANSTYEFVYLANDAANLYVGLDTAGTDGGSISNSWTRNIYVDSDMNPATGFNAGWMTHGYDRLIQYGAGGATYSIFEFSGSVQSEWSWNWLGLISYAYSNDVAELSIPRSSLGISSNALVLEFNVSGGDVTADTWASEFESAAETYTMAEFSGSYPVITLDGILDEWDNPGHVLYNDAEIRDGVPANSSYEDLYLVNDATTLYIGLDTKETGGASITNVWTRNIYLDTDTDGGTGFTGGWMTHGYDRLIQYGASGTTYSIFKFTGATQGEWAWEFVTEISYAYSDDAIEMSVPLSALGMAGDSFAVEFNVGGDGVSTETWAAVQETGAKTYTLLDNGELVPIGFISIANLSGATMALSWNAAAAQAYDVEYKNNLVSDSAWQNYTSIVAQAGGGITVTTTVDQVETFYRVVSP